MIITDHRTAFTLVELSIVLVILGLLIGGVLTGQSLIRAAELRSISTQHARYITATHTFRDKYFSLPGDMPNAQSYWGVAHATPSTCANTASTSALTCNGDGNGQIDVSTGANERFRFWQHLANAGLIEGSYNGIRASTATNSASSANAPAGKISGSLWFTNYSGAVSGLSQAFSGQYDNAFLHGAFATNGVPDTPILKPEEAYNIDTKIDDGKPGAGKVFVNAPNGLNKCTTTSSNVDYTATYLLSSSTINCNLYFIQAF